MRLLDTLTLVYTTATGLCEEDHYDLFTTLSAIATSISNQEFDLTAQMTNNYVDSLTTEQLAEFDELLAQKENELDLGNGQKVVIPPINDDKTEMTSKKM